MDMGSLKQTLSDASTFVTRAVQYTEEKLGKAERTDLDPYIVMLENKTDSCKAYTEKIKNNTAAVLVPNPAARAEAFFFDTVPVNKIGIKNERLTNLEYLGTDMVEAGNEFGVGTPYGSALIRVGQTQQRLGQIERDYIRTGHEGIIAPLQRFLDGEMKNIMRERKILENKRLDLDACKNKVRKARSLATQPQAENELRLSQSEFDRQAEITKLLMEGLAQTQTNHVRHLKAFVESQVNYYEEAHKCMQELNSELSGTMEPNGIAQPVLRAETNGGTGVQDDMSQIPLTSPPASFPANAHVF